MVATVSGSFADRLNHLFATITPSPGREYTNEQVAEAIRAIGVQISQSYIWQLRKAKKDNPTLRHVQALANFFGVPAAYFFEDDTTDRVNQQLADLTAERQRLTALANRPQTAVMAMRAGELSTEGLKQVNDLIDVIHRLETAERT